MAGTCKHKKNNTTYLIIIKVIKSSNSVQLHTGIKSSKEREKIRPMILKGFEYISMLSPGFDLPDPKLYIP